ncbi:SdpI family protein [Bacillus sp. FJAT-53711]|uniref:Immunity protein SdpI n=1 Tax=Bacillus yunxiaonensis TaxID=3127665 RepID=A0ABU8G1E6_9BACI
MRKHIVPWLLILTIAMGWYIAWPHLPEQIPRHYNIEGEVDGYFSKVSAMSLSMGSMIFFYIVWIFIRRIDLTKGEYKYFAKALSKVNYMILITIFGSNILGILHSVGYDVKGSVMVNFALGTLSIILGNYMQQTKPNYLIGIRTSWTLENAEVWRKTHRFASKTMVIAGFFVYAAALLKDPINIFIGMGIVLLGAIIPTVKSYSIYKRKTGLEGKS